MENKQLVTIAIPAYKSVFLAEAIQSALNQTYSCIELVIVNDKSPFNIEGVVKTFNDPRIRYYENEENLGKTSIVLNWNRCLEYAKGDFFVLLCDDDLLAPSFVEELVKLANQFITCNIFHARRALIFENGEIQEENTWPQHETYNDFFISKFKGQRRHTITEFLYRTNVLRINGYIDFPIAYYSDDATILSICRTGGICSSLQVLAYYRYNDQHVSGNLLLNYRKIDACFEFYDWLELDPLYVKNKDLVDNFLHSGIFSYFLDAPFITKIKILNSCRHHLFGLRAKMVLIFDVLRYYFRIAHHKLRFA